MRKKLPKLRTVARRAKKRLTSPRILTPPPSELRLTPQQSPVLLALKKEAARVKAEIERQQVLTQDHPTSGNHMADDATEVFEQTKNLALKRNLERTLEQIELAIRRMEKGTYGSCEKCGGAIPAERLEALPYATTCMTCAKSIPHAA